MQLTYLVARMNPRNRKRLLTGSKEIEELYTRSAASLSMSFWAEEPYRNYHFFGKATLSFDHLDDVEYCSIWGSITTIPDTPEPIRFYGCVTYVNPKQSPPVDGLICSFGGRIKFPGPHFHMYPSLIPSIGQAVRPTLQQQLEQVTLANTAYMLIKAGASLVIDQETRP